MDTLRTVRSLLVTPCIAALMIVGCARSYTGASSNAPRASIAPRSVSLRAIDGTAFAGEPDRPLLDMIQRYWPNVASPPWALSFTPTREIDRVGVYANGSLIGGLDAIRGIPAWRAAKVRRMTPSEEAMAFGRQHAAGAVVIDWVKD